MIPVWVALLIVFGVPVILITVILIIVLLGGGAGVGSLRATVVVDLSKVKEHGEVYTYQVHKDLITGEALNATESKDKAIVYEQFWFKRIQHEILLNDHKKIEGKTWTLIVNGISLLQDGSTDAMKKLRRQIEDLESENSELRAIKIKHQKETGKDVDGVIKTLGDAQKNAMPFIPMRSRTTRS